MFDRAVRYVAVGSLAPPRRLPQPDPVRSVVTGAAESLRIYEGFQEVQWVTIEALPVLGDAHRHAAQNVGCQMLDFDPRQNQEARVVGEEANVASSRFRTPAEVTVACSQVARRTRPGQASKRSRLPPHQILQVLANRLLIAKVMMLF